MLDTLFWVALGAFVGWNFPQPFWAKIIQEKIQSWKNTAVLTQSTVQYRTVQHSTVYKYTVCMHAQHK